MNAESKQSYHPRKIAHVVGNGPSNVKFKPEEHPNSSVFYCNFGPNEQVYKSYNPRFHFVIVDKKPIHQMNLGERELTPNKVILSDRAHKFYKESNFKLNIFDVVENQKVVTISNNLWMNSGHIATMYCINHGFDKINLWGIDSLKNNSLISATDGFKKRESAQIARVWRKYWEHIFILADDIVINT